MKNCRGFCLLLFGVLVSEGLAGAVDGPPSHIMSYADAIPRRCVDSTVGELPCAGVAEDRLLPHPGDCELFYYCVGEVAVCRQCPARLHFNPEKHVCDNPERAGCVRAARRS